MEKILRFKSDNGVEFDTEKEAKYHDNMLKFEQWYEKNKLYGNIAGSCVDWDDLIDWLQNNRAEIKKLLIKLRNGYE